MILFVHKVGTSIAIPAADEVDAKTAIRAVVAIRQKKTMRKFRSHDTLITVLRFGKRSLAINAIFEISKRLMAIVALAHSPCTTHEITILRIPTVIGVFTVLTREPIIIDSSRMWHRFRKVLELLKERF